MVDFSNISKHKPQAEQPVALRIDIPGLEDEVVLQVLPALLINRRLASAQQKFASRMAKKLERKDGPSIQDLEDSQRALHEQFAKYVIVGWSGVFDVNGDEVDYSIETCIQLLGALRDEIFDEIVRFCKDAENFVEVEDPEELGKP